MPVLVFLLRRVLSGGGLFDLAEYLIVVLRRRPLLDEVDDLLALLVGDESALHTKRLYDAERRIEHIAHADELFRARVIENDARFKRTRNGKRDAARDVGLHKAGDDIGGLSPLLCRELSLGGWEGLDAALDALRARIDTGDFTPVMISIDGMPKDYTFQPVYQYGSRAELTEFSSFSELLDTFYRKKDQQENLRRRSADLTRTAKTARDRLLRKIAAREQELLETEKREEYRRRGDLITANMYRLKRGMRSFEAQDYYEPDCPTVTVPLDERKTPQQNAAYNYKLYNKAKTANRMLTELIAGAREDEAYLESVLDELSRAECDRDLADIRRELVNAGYIKEKTQGKRQKQPAARKPLRFVSDSGTEILVGRGNVQNDELTLHIARRTDLWLHVQKLPGSHVIVSQAEGEADEETIRQAAALAATYSQAKTGGKVAVDCTQVRFVKKPSGAKPGRVIYTDYRTIITSADEALAERLRKD